MTVSLQGAYEATWTNIESAVRAESDARARIARALETDEEKDSRVVDQARYDATKARHEQRHWRETRSYWWWLLSHYPDKAREDCGEVARAFGHLVPPHGEREVPPEPYTRELDHWSERDNAFD